MDDKQWMDAGAPTDSRCQQKAVVFFRVISPFPTSAVCLCQQCALRRKVDFDYGVVMLSEEEFAQLTVVMEIHQS